MTTVEAAKTRLEAALTRLEQAIEHRLADDSGAAAMADPDNMRRKLADLESQHQDMRQRYARAVAINSEIVTRLDGAIETVKTIVAE